MEMTATAPAPAPVPATASASATTAMTTTTTTTTISTNTNTTTTTSSTTTATKPRPPPTPSSPLGMIKPGSHPSEPTCGCTFILVTNGLLPVSVAQPSTILIILAQTRQSAARRVYSRAYQTGLNDKCCAVFGASAPPSLCTHPKAGSIGSIAQAQFPFLHSCSPHGIKATVVDLPLVPQLLWGNRLGRDAASK